MKTLEELTLLEDRFYTDEHIWVKKDGDAFLLGISDFAQDKLGEIAYVEMPSIGDTFSAGTDFGIVESTKSVNNLYMPFDGAVLTFNEELEENPTLINSDCYEKGWIIKIKANNSEDFNKMLSFADYKAFLAK